MHRRHKQVSHRRTGPDVSQRFRNFIKLELRKFIHAFIAETALTLGFIWGLASFIWRYFFAEFLIIFAVIGWCLLSLESAAELHGRAGLVLVSEYLS